MTTLDNLRTLKLELEANLKQEPGAERRDWIEGELQKIEIALSFLDDGWPSLFQGAAERARLSRNRCV